MKKIKSFLIALFLVTSFNNIFSQIEKTVIFDSLKLYVYSAKFISNYGITTNEKIHLLPSGLPWEFQKTQTKYSVKYFPSDSLINLVIDPTSKKGEKISRRIISSTTGAFENDEKIWIHPFRDNQYKYTEVAPFPYIRFDSLMVGKSWDGDKTFILSGWGKFKGNVTSKYQIVGNKKIDFNGIVLENCWEIVATSIHNKLGQSDAKFIFHAKYGFIEMNYKMYDGTLIDFKLEEVILK